ncbi:hypothetical protein R1sor_019607 [Riccia sorocarpa]|uniref:Uncharacterized protein n=1 Tax=Riccia sorocarpa TaxID=122646 RepID=A0ABD3IGT3_9MARC
MDSEVDRSDTNARRTLWDGDMTTSRKEPGGAFVNIISTYTMTFGDDYVDGCQYVVREDNKEVLAPTRTACGTWYNAVFKYATIVNPLLGPEFLTTVRELHNALSRQPKVEREVVYNVGVDSVKAFASAGRSSKTKGKGPWEEKVRKPRRKKDDEEEVGPSTTETVNEMGDEEAIPVAETAPPEGRQPKR